MKKGRRVFGIIIVSLLLISSVSLVSAGLKDWLGFGDDSDLEGELAETAVARVKVLDVSPPVVVFVSDVEDGKGTQNTVTPNIRTVVGGDISVSFNFLAQQGGGVGNLDSTPGTIHSNGAFFRLGSITRTNLSCVTLGQVACGTFCIGNAVNYSCTIIMRYYDDPATGEWAVNATVYDTFNNRGNNQTKTFDVGTVSGASSDENYLNWTSPPLQSADANRYSDNDYMVINNGNTIFSNTKVNATGLVGISDPSFSILASKFTANSANPGTCGGTNLIQDDGPTIAGFTVPKATSETISEQELYFCLKDVVGLSSQEYNATRPWKITFA